MDENEKLKTEFNTEKAAWAEEKASLIKRAEKAEASLEEVNTELTRMKHHINQMTFAIFCKTCYIVMTFHPPCYKPLGDLIIICHAGPRSSNLGKEILIKLKAVYTLVKQLYTGAHRTIDTISPSNQAPSLLSNVLSQLSVRLPVLKKTNGRLLEPVP